MGGRTAHSPFVHLTCQWACFLFFSWRHFWTIRPTWYILEGQQVVGNQPTDHAASHLQREGDHNPIGCLRQMRYTDLAGTMIQGELGRMNLARARARLSGE